MPSKSPHRWRDGPPWALEATVYLALALGAVSASLGADQVVPGDGVDLYGTLWFYWWIGECLQTLQDPSWTDLFFHPFGKDIFGHTGNNFLDAGLSAPLQWALGSPRYYTLWVAVVLLGNALSFRLLARSEIADRWGAFAATALFTANPYVMYELTSGRPTQALLWFVPLAIWGVLHADRAWWVAALGGAGAALAGYTYWFYGYFLAFAFAWLVGVGAARRWRDPGGDPRRYLRGVGIAAAVALALVAPAVAAMAAHGESGLPATGSWPPRLEGGALTSLQGYSLLERWGPRFLHHPAWALGALGWLALGRGRLRWLGVAAVGLAVAVGPFADWGGRKVELGHYSALVAAVPFFYRLWYPYRAVLLVFVALSLGIGFAVARLGELCERRWTTGWLAAPLLGLALLAGSLVTQVPDHTWPLTHRDVSPPPVLAWMAGHPGALLELPRGVSTVGIVHQTTHRMPLFEGMGANAPFFWPDAHRRRLEDPFVQALVAAVQDPDGPAPAPGRPDLLLDHGVRWILLHRDLLETRHQERHRRVAGGGGATGARHQRATRRLVALLGEPVAVDGPLVVWSLVQVPPAPLDLRPTEDKLRERTWEAPALPAYEHRLRELGRLE